MPQNPHDRTGPDIERPPPEDACGRPLDAADLARIGRCLRLRHADVLAMPIPEHLRTLIDALATRLDPKAPR